ncbi:MAG: hypothetical protein EOO43_11735 [Flavobacterium sp.]|nr:MAG: hypothetical protein EOO43_11735 [Flavobacterium sp.]
MPQNPLTELDLQNYNHTLSKKDISPDEQFNTLKSMYSRFATNEENLIRLEYALDLKRTEEDYFEQRKICEERLNELKTQYKQIENRITAAEQKLTRGIPDDLELMDKMIAEQESIVSEQEKLNNAETMLIKEFSAIDITYGKALEKLEQMLNNRISPLFNKFNVYIQNLENSRQRIKLKSDIIYLLPLIGLPLIADLSISGIFGTAGSIAKGHNILNHYVFFIVLIGFQVFLAERVKKLISELLAPFQLQKSFNELEKLFRQNSETTIALEAQYTVFQQQIQNKPQSL